MDSQKAQLLERIKTSANVLITVSANPSVDQLAACIGLTLALNKLGKHATAVFSGNVPSTIEFLKPEQTLEKNTDSLRDFIISLDKSKADKLRYKVEDKLVRIFITPYRTSISEKDLEFSQGDFNVDLVIALGVQDQKDLDQAIIAHGRILHDAAVASVNTTPGGELGTIHWIEQQASSLSEMVAGVAEELKTDILDEQIATALLTGIVAETHRFSNEKTTSATMNVSAKLMAAGANQQLVATKLQERASFDDHPQYDPLKINELANEDEQVPSEPPDKPPKADDGSLLIEHTPETPKETDVTEEKTDTVGGIHIDEHGTLIPATETTVKQQEDDPAALKGPKLVLQPPTLGGRLTANDTPEALSPSTDPLSTLPPLSPPLLNHDSDLPAGHSDKADALHFEDPALRDVAEPALPAAEPVHPEPPVSPLAPAAGPVPPPVTPTDNQPPVPVTDDPKPTTDAGSAPTLADLEESVDSSHQQEQVSPEQNPNLNQARDAVLEAINATTDPSPSPIAALNAKPVNLDLGHGPSLPALDSVQPAPAEDSSSYDIMSTGVTGTEFKLPGNLVDPNTGLPPDTTGPSVENPTAPPPVPPPLPPLMPPVAGPQADDQSPLPPNPFNLPQ